MATPSRCRAGRGVNVGQKDNTLKANETVLGAYEKHVAGPRREAIARAEKAEKERDEAQVAQAIQGERLVEARAWNERRLQAEARGERFGEPFLGDVESEDA